MPVRHQSPAPCRRPSTRSRGLPPLCRAAGLVIVALLAGPRSIAQEASPATAAERLKLTTSDGVPLAAWFYPAARPETDDGAEEEVSPSSVVILLHDLGGSHESVEPLATALQSQGIAVVAPDLRGHGASSGPTGRADLDSKSIKKPDFDAMVMTGGGQVREDALRRGDVETVRNWIGQNAARHALDPDKLIVVGSGVGAAVAAQWTVLDAKWPDLASGPQGKQVRGLVLVSPAWTTRGFSISPALAADPVRRTIPVLVIAGEEDADAVKLYDQLKKARPDQWSEKRAGQAAPTQSPRLARDAQPSLYLRQFPTGLSGDRLVADDRGGGQAIIQGFVTAVTAVER